MSDLRTLMDLPDPSAIATVWPAVVDSEPVGNELGVLAHVASVVERGQVLQPAIATWLADGIRAYLAAPAVVTLGAALGLEGKSGTAEIKRSTQAEQMVLARWLAMTRLYALGATKDEAAALAVARYPGASVETVARQLGKADAEFMRMQRDYWQRRLSRSDLITFLTLFPDDLSTRDAKRALLKLYPS